MQIIVRALVLFLFVWFVTRAMGRKELSELSSFELILLIAVGDLIQQGVTGDDRSLVGAMLAVTTFALLTVVLSYLQFRFKRLRPPLEGTPAIVVVHGEIQTEVIRIERLTAEDVQEAAREQGISDLAEIRIGVLEADGKFSFLREGDVRRPPGTDELAPK
jgi:uncharacterized membrane protein YcaP (DUF421 family)